MVIEEKLSTKLPTYTSLYFQLPFYSPELFSLLVQTKDAIFDKEHLTFEFPTNRLGFLVDTLIKYGDISVKTMRDPTINLVDIEKYEFKKKLYQHQLDGIKYGISRNSGWLLLDDQGLGKTATMICMAEILKKKEHLEHCLIICGVNGLKYNWENEVKKFSDLSCRILGQKITRNGKAQISSIDKRCEQLAEGIDEFFIITNVETLRSKKFADALNKGKTKCDLIIMDEAHKCKDPTSLASKTLLKLKAKRKIALTGTLIMNNPENAYISLKWTDNTKSTFTQFKNTYNLYGGFGGVQVIGHRNLELLQELISHCSLRRMKSDVLDLPPKVFQTDIVEMYTEQQKLYDEVAAGILAELDKLDHKPSIIEEITINMRLRQITSFPGALSSDVQKSAKLDRMCDLVEDIVSQGDKVVVFTGFKEVANEAYRLLSPYNPVIVTGDNNDEESERNKYIFQNDEECKVFIGTWQKCGTGYTLTAANYLIFIDTPWTYADFIQSADRIYRIGQTKTSFIITLITKDSYDERVEEILGIKKDISDYVIDKKDVKKFSENS